MESNKLDFGGLFSGKTPEPPRNAPETPPERFSEKKSYPIRPIEKSAYRGAESQRAAARRSDGEKTEQKAKKQVQTQADADRAELFAIRKHYQENTLKSEQLRNSIMKGIYDGQPITDLFLQAIKAISIMNDCEEFYNIVSESVKAIYGLGLREPAALAAELADVTGRLEHLQEAYLWAENDEKRRIMRAIKAHEKRIAMINSLLCSGKA